MLVSEYQNNHYMYSNLFRSAEGKWNSNRTSQEYRLGAWKLFYV